MLRRNRFGFRMRRRSLTGRLFQFLVVLTVVSLFIYLLLYALNFNRDYNGPDFTWLKTRNMSHFVKPEESTLILEPLPSNEFCRAADKLRLLVVVHSSPHNYERRRVIRKTWGRALKMLPGVRMVFFLGQIPHRDDIQAEVVREHTDNNDLVQHEFVDTFVNLTVKTTFLFKWITSNECLTAKFLFKTDDDTFVNPSQLWASLEHSLLHTATTKSLLPFLKKRQLSTQELQSSSPALSESIDYLVMGRMLSTVPIRDEKQKWYLPMRFYPLNIFPRHLSGSGYVLSMSIVPLMYECMLRTPYMNLEDVMLTGLCATTQMGLKLTDNTSFRHKKPAVSPNYVCFYKKAALVHGLTSAELDEMWVRITDDHNCDTFYFAFVEYLTISVEFFKNLFRL